MGLLQDILKEVPLSSVLRERVALAEARYQHASEEISTLKQRIADLERLNGELRAQVPTASKGELDPETIRVMSHLFKVSGDDLDAGLTARALGMQQNLLQYHLDRLHEIGFAHMTGGNYVSGHTYWGLTPEGRRYVVERKLH
jgi:Fic family protein